MAWSLIWKNAFFGPLPWTTLATVFLQESDLSLLTYVQAVEEVPQPGTVKQLQAFLRLVNFYRRFLPAIASKLKPLTDTLKGDVQGMDVPAVDPPDDSSVLCSQGSPQQGYLPGSSSSRCEYGVRGGRF